MRLLLVFLLLLPAVPSVADDFERAYERARNDACCGARAAYDRELGRFFQTQPMFAPRLDICARRHPGKHAVRGYFEFARNGAYRLVLRPEGPFARCVSTAFEGQSVPKPPVLPYRNPFTHSAGR